MLGLGLITVKRLVEAYGGQVNIDSIPGQQTVVLVLLRTRAHMQAEPGSGGPLHGSTRAPVNPE